MPRASGLQQQAALAEGQQGPSERGFPCLSGWFVLEAQIAKTHGGRLLMRLRFCLLPDLDMRTPVGTCRADETAADFAMCATSPYQAAGASVVAGGSALPLLKSEAKNVFWN